ncbi:hypothetical protein J8J27_34435, partial [Mycobacterium tuberculosis]|nr:hypothetical protein [Mycobacterium tuberculosis]
VHAVERRARHRADDHWHNHLCAGYKLMFAHMDPYMRFMAEQLRRRQAPAEVMKVAPMIAAEQSRRSAASSPASEPLGM